MSDISKEAEEIFYNDPEYVKNFMFHMVDQEEYDKDDFINKYVSHQNEFIRKNENWEVLKALEPGDMITVTCFHPDQSIEKPKFNIISGELKKFLPLTILIIFHDEKITPVHISDIYRLEYAS